MSGDYKQARYRDGRPYSGVKQFLGTGVNRSCGKCGQHSASAGFKLIKPWGMVGQCCQKKEAA